MSFLGIGLLSLSILVGCADKSRRLSESESLQYKGELLRSRQREVGPAQANRFFYHPARTKNELDRAFETFTQEYSAEQARERASFSKQQGTFKGADSAGASEPELTGSAKERALRQARQDAERFSGQPRSDPLPKDGKEQGVDSDENSLKNK